MNNRIHFTSDHHFFHINIIRYSKRPFKNIDEMNEVLVDNWNKQVARNDVVYHLGDIFLGQRQAENLRSHLNGQIYLIRGNHDKTADQCRHLFGWIKDYFKLRVNDPDCERGIREIALFHYPIASWDKHHHGCYHAHGHCHSNHNPWKIKHMPDARSFDVGVDSVAEYLAKGGEKRPEDYRPLSYEELKEIMNTRSGQLDVDHHSEDRE
jgi:calcineurin-like phosphoesterase family protein